MITMNANNNEDLWLSCCLGFKIGLYVSDRLDKSDMRQLIEVLEQIAGSELALTDPGQNAARFDRAKEVMQSIGHASNQSDFNLAGCVLEALRSQQDE